MHPNAAQIERLYRAFEALDGKTMQACYAPDAVFRDEAFELEGAQAIGAMWQMLCEAARDRGAANWRLAYSGVEADDEQGRAHWEPQYLFGPQGRRVHNVIDAEFRFRDGLIVSHVDRFDFVRWSRQALGPAGWLFGWSPWLRAKVRKQAARGLARWRRQRGMAATGGSPPG